MPITITCPFCDHSRQIPDGFPRDRARCPKCGTFVPVPRPDPEENAKRRGIPPWLIAMLIAVGILALFFLGAMGMMAMRGGGE